MRKPRDTHVYHLFHGREKVYTGLSSDLERRTEDHHRAGKEFSRVEIDGPARTRASAERREAEALDTYRRNHGGLNPRYNKTRDG